MVSASTIVALTLFDARLSRPGCLLGQMWRKYGTVMRFFFFRPAAGAPARPVSPGAIRSQQATEPQAARLRCWILLGAVALLSACATNRFEKPRVGAAQRGIASWYGEPFHGRATASGEIYDMHQLTAAHKELPLGTVVKVRNLENGKTVTVRVNDRGPFVKGRIIDLSLGAAKQISMVGPGTAKVEMTVVRLGSGPPGPNMSTRFTVQVGAFQERVNAERLREELAADHSDVELIRDGQWHRVRVGRFSSQSQADEVRKALRRKGLPAMVIALN